MSALLFLCQIPLWLQHFHSQYQREQEKLFRLCTNNSFHNHQFFLSRQYFFMGGEGDVILLNGKRIEIRVGWRTSLARLCPARSRQSASLLPSNTRPIWWTNRLCAKVSHHDSFFQLERNSSWSPTVSLAAHLSLWLRYYGGDGSPVQQQNLTAELHEGFKPRESLQSKQPNLIRARQQLKEHSIVAWSSNLVINQENQSGRSSECCAEKPRMTPVYKETDDVWAREATASFFIQDSGELYRLHRNREKKNEIKSLTSVFILIFWSIDWSIEYQLRKGVLFDKKRIRRMKKNVRSFFHLFMLHLYIYHMYMPLYTV